MALGVRKLRITGGEPLLRRDLPQLIEQLSQIGGVEDIAMTTNGLLLPRLAADLKAAGLQRVTVSLDTLDPEVFGQMNGLGVHPDRVMAGIEAALTAGLGVKINTVVQRGVNDAGAGRAVAALRGKAVVRFIEFMDVGNHNGWNMSQVVPSREVIARLSAGGEAAAPAGRPLPGRGRRTLRRRPGLRGGRDQQRHGAVLRRLLAGAALGGGTALHLLVCHPGP